MLIEDDVGVSSSGGIVLDGGSKGVLDSIISDKDSISLEACGGNFDQTDVDDYSDDENPQEFLNQADVLF